MTVEDPIDRERVERYLDGCVRHWRNLRDGRPVPPPAYEPGGAHSDLEAVLQDPTPADLRDVARYYVDAFQSARLSLLGSVLP